VASEVSRQLINSHVIEICRANSIDSPEMATFFKAALKIDVTKRIVFEQNVHLIGPAGYQ